MCHILCASMTESEMKPETTRFAPSPTGRLHLGHAYSALFAERLARKSGGRFLLRIEDIDTGRSRPEHEAAICEDLAWLGLSWEQPVWRQSARLPHYRAALDRLDAAGLLYPCFCTRKMIRAEIAAIGQAPHLSVSGPDGPIYPGTCRELGKEARASRIAAGDPFALRLNMARAISQAMSMAGEISWRDRREGPQAMRADIFGDIVIARKDVPVSYHLAVTIDDAAQGVSLVTRGADLLPASHIHRLLQALLDLPVPDWHHHPILRDQDGNRLAKRLSSVSLADLREGGKSPGWVRETVAELAADAAPI